MGTKILNSRWFYVVLSILLAFLLWVYVGNDPNSVDTGTCGMSGWYSVDWKSLKSGD